MPDDQPHGRVCTGTYGTEHPSGTGPFKFESWTREDRLVLVRNDDYWRGAPKLDGIIRRQFADISAAILAFEGGEDHVGTVLEWGVRQLGKPVTVHAEGDLPAKAVADLFPAYDDDGGLLLVLTPSR